ncbi:addiction module antidote protein [Amphiplicatus metriothermophilus]|uniref:Probable addiction module antidote protein n=1 Tax=Amphiplicatus metriothermophilus TaxID=1519374 RepID=A0A239PLP1_9PROT|nr:addiction module antidote protein [Amphiplicatus metriothermophilus]MBB5517416.1 putative addiction module antidote protein [Amphiplicatus metriothermophilus]SNT68249.1 probable addiction module antidote protein [Amphiplicatus metriothermophilus]
MTVKTTRFDPADHLKTPEDVVAFLEATIEEDGDDPEFIARALGAAARARGMSEIARAAGLGRASLYKALSEDGNPSFATVTKVARALGVRVRFEPAAG